MLGHIRQRENTNRGLLQPDLSVSTANENGLNKTDSRQRKQLFGSHNLNNKTRMN